MVRLLIPERKPKPLQATASLPEQSTISVPKLQAQVLCNLGASLPNQLSIRKFDKLTIVQVESNGWTKVMHNANGQVGMVPTTHYMLEATTGCCCCCSSEATTTTCCSTPTSCRCSSEATTTTSCSSKATKPNHNKGLLLLVHLVERIHHPLCKWSNLLLKTVLHGLWLLPIVQLLVHDI
jgi:hypothetical protein